MPKSYRSPESGPALFYLWLLIPFTWPVFVVPWAMKRVLGREKFKLLPDAWQVILTLLVMVINFVFWERVRHLWM